MDLLIAYAIPVFVLSMVFEHLYTRKQGTDSYERKDTAASIGMGLGAVLFGLPFRLLFLWVLSWLYQYRLFTIDPTLGSWLALLLAEDFCYYCSHRANHQVRMFWAAHVNHHSSERYNLSTALRQSWTQPYLMWVFWLPLPLLGFSPQMILLQQAISLVYQFFIHTQTVKRLGPLEWVLNTPSHHRVHHAVNLRYLDRNHGGILILWDRLFGTFAAERDDDVPVYGITTNIKSYNLLHISFHEWRAMLKDAACARGPWNTLKYLWAAPGFSPDGRTQTAAQMRAQLVGSKTLRTQALGDKSLSPAE